MAIKQSRAKAVTSPKEDAPPAKTSAPAPKDRALEALEAKVSALEAKLAAQEQVINSLKNAKPAASGQGLSKEVLAELRRYFATAPSTKVPTHWPKL